MNSWKVMWLEDGRKRHKTFPGNSPKTSGAVDYAKERKIRGLTVYVISVGKAFPPPLVNPKLPHLGFKEAPPGLLWCPYCIAFREFHEAALRIKLEGGVIDGPEAWRCTVCTISIYDYFVRSYNEFMVSRLDPKLRLKKPRISRNTEMTGPKRKKKRR